MPYLKVLVCDINAFSSLWCGCIFILCYTHLNLALLYHIQGFVNAQMVTTVTHEKHGLEPCLQFLPYLDLYSCAVLTSTILINRIELQSKEKILNHLLNEP